MAMRRKCFGLPGYPAPERVQLPKRLRKNFGKLASKPYCSMEIKCVMGLMVILDSARTIEKKTFGGWVKSPGYSLSTEILYFAHSCLHIKKTATVPVISFLTADSLRYM